jgi:Tfp pilus assembly protein FimT
MHLVPMPPAIMKSEAGFTLIEALVVVGLVAVMAGATVPAVAGGLARYSLTNAAQQVASTVRAARFHAVGTNRNVRIVIDAATGDYHREALDPVDGWVRITRTGERDDAGAETFSIGDGISFAGGAPVNVEFDTQGRLAGGAALTITVTNGNEAQNRSVVISARGRTTID